MKAIFDNLPEEKKKKISKATQPEWESPMLATLTDERFSDEDWIYERKFDGERCLAFGNGKEISLKSRNKTDLNKTYPEIVDALLEQDVGSFIADGEIVAFEGNLTSFSRLQNRIQIKNAREARESGVAVYYYLFDLLYLGSRDITGLDLRSRKKLLKKAFRFEKPLRFTQHRNREGEDYYETACKKGWEGIIAKNANSRYEHSRSKNWLKFKCGNQQEFVIGGYTDPKGSRTGFGALLIGYYRGRKLFYAGKVGTGFDDETLDRIADRLDSIERKTSPFEDPQNEISHKGVHWVSPKLVCQIGFTEWTGDNKLRHPRFLGIRRDKEPGDVVKETPEKA